MYTLYILKPRCRYIAGCNYASPIAAERYAKLFYPRFAFEVAANLASVPSEAGGRHENDMEVAA